jgi:hypothetical protein
VAVSPAFPPSRWPARDSRDAKRVCGQALKFGSLRCRRTALGPALTSMLATPIFPPPRWPPGRHWSMGRQTQGIIAASPLMQPVS